MLPSSSTSTISAKQGAHRSTTAANQRRIEIIFTRPSDIKLDEDLIVDRFNPHEIASRSFAKYYSKHDYSDLPEHWKYLENVVMLETIVFPAAEVIVVEKYKNVAICFDHFGTKRPVIFFRECTPYYKSIKIGDILTVGLRKLYVHAEKPTLMFTDLYGILLTLQPSSIDNYEISISHRLLKINKFAFEVREIQHIHQSYVMFADFGTIVLRRKAAKILGSKELQGAFVIGSIKYTLQCVSPTRAACWKLGSSFEVFRDGIIYARSLRGQFVLVEEVEKKKRLEARTGRKLARMVIPVVEKKFISLRGDFDWSFSNHSGFLIFIPHLKRYGRS